VNTVGSHTIIITVFPRIKAQAFISFPALLAQPLNEWGLYSRPGVYFQYFRMSPQRLIEIKP